MRRISVFGWGVVVAMVASLPWVVPQMVNLWSLLMQGGAARLGLAPFGLIFLVTCVPLGLLMWGIAGRNRVALALSVVIFPYVWLGGLESWISSQTGQWHNLAVGASLILAALTVGFYVWLFKMGNKLKRARTN